MLNKNKKGDVPVTILVIGVLAICMLALMSFHFSSNNNQILYGVGLIETVKSVEREIIFERDCSTCVKHYKDGVPVSIKDQSRVASHWETVVEKKGDDIEATFFDKTPLGARKKIAWVYYHPIPSP